MQGGRNPFFGVGDPFANFGGFGEQPNMMSSFFGGKDPFDDPFFTRPFGGVFESSFFGPSRSPFMDARPFIDAHPFMGARPFIDAHPFMGARPFIDAHPFMGAHPSGFLQNQPSQPPRSRGLIIEELNSDGEKDENEGTQEKKENPRKHGRSSKEPLVEDPDGEAEERRSKQMQCRTDYHQGNITQSQPRAHSFTFNSSSVTYGGANGAYYTSSNTRRTGSDGVTFEESKEANSVTRQATHRVLKGIHDKGHSVTRNLNSDGRVGTMQTLHNLEEDELAGFEERWKGKARKHLPGWSEGIDTHDVIGSGSRIPNGPNRGGWALPYVGRSHEQGNSVRPDMRHAAGPSHPQHQGKGKADPVGMLCSSSRARSKAPDIANSNQATKH